MSQFDCGCFIDVGCTCENLDHITPTDNKAPREWTVVGINQPFQDHLLVLVNGPKVQDGELGFKVIEKSAYDKLQQELEAVRAENNSLKKDFVIEHDLMNKFGDERDQLREQLNDAKAQIADYESALEYYKSTWDVGIKATETLNKWKEK